MINYDKVLESLSHLVGWDSKYDNYRINPYMYESESGLYFQEAHPLLTLRAMNSIAPKYLLDNKPDWDATKNYMRGDIVRYEGLYYKAFDSSRGKVPSTNPVNWYPTSELSEYLEDMRTASIKQVVSRFERDKVIGLETRPIVDRRTLFDGAGSINSRVKNQGKLVGFEITPLRSGGIITQINKIGLQMIGNVGDFPIYLFHSSCKQPLGRLIPDISHNDGTFEWFEAEDMYMPYRDPYTSMDATTMDGGSWYLCYHQNQLPPYMEAINFQRDWSREPCGTCNKGDAQLYRTMSKYFTISPFCVDLGDDWDGTLWDIRNNVYTPNNNYGINIQFTIACDLTNYIVDSKRMFAKAIQLQVAHNALRALALNPDVNVNRVQYNADRGNILFEAEGDGQAIKGLHHDLEKEYKALSFSTKGWDEACLSCHNGGIRIRSI